MIKLYTKSYEFSDYDYSVKLDVKRCISAPGSDDGDFDGEYTLDTSNLIINRNMIQKKELNNDSYLATILFEYQGRIIRAASYTLSFEGRFDANDIVENLNRDIEYQIAPIGGTSYRFDREGFDDGDDTITDSDGEEREVTLTPVIIVH